MPKHSPADILAALRAEGIQCEPHELGLARYAGDPRAYAKALKACQPTVLRVLTMDGDASDAPLQPPPCTEDPMICTCEQHSAERVVAIRKGPARITQPWEPRVSRRAA